MSDANGMRVYYWPDGTWCYPHELPGMRHKSDDYCVYLARYEDSDEDIDSCIRQAVIEDDHWREHP
jgi:hypothetical protein